MDDLFEVGTEFKFDVGEALVNTNALKGAVDNLSDSADSALTRLGYLAGGLVAHLGLGSGGLLTMLSQAVQLSEAFNAQSLMLSQNITSNFAVLAGTIGTFNDRLETSQMIMDNIRDTAIRVGLPAADLARMTTMFATPLANRGKLGTNYEGAIRMGKNVMLGAEMSGINPQAAAESVYRAMTDHMALHGALFARLANTPQFKNAHVTTQQQFMGMNADKKIDLLDRALGSLANDADALAYRLNSVKVQFQMLKDLVGEILQPIGNVLRGALANLFHGLTGFLKVNAKGMGESIARVLGDLLKDPQALFVNMRQLSHLKSDFSLAKKLAEYFMIFRAVSWFATTVLGITFNGGLVAAAFRYVVQGLWSIMAFVPWGTILTFVFNSLIAAVTEFLPVFLMFLWIFQTISRARAKAELSDIKEWTMLTPKFLNVFAKLKPAFENILRPFTFVTDVLSDLLAPLFSTATYGKAALWVLESLSEWFIDFGNAVVGMMAILNGAMAVLVNGIADLIHGHLPTDMGARYSKGFEAFWKYHQEPNDPNKSTSHHVTNIGKIEIRNDFKEQLEPDRIAFSLKEQLMKVAQNPTQARGGSFRAAFAGSTTFGGSR